MNKQPEPTIKWVFTSWQGRLGRQSYFLAAALMMVIQIFILVKATQLDRNNETHMLTLGFGLIAFWLVCAWAMLAMTIKRLHDINQPSILAVGLLMPMLNMVLLIAMMAMPSYPESNEHGPPPFGRG